MVSKGGRKGKGKGKNNNNWSENGVNFIVSFEALQGAIKEEKKKQNPAARAERNVAKAAENARKMENAVAAQVAQANAEAKARANAAAKAAKAAKAVEAKAQAAQAAQAQAAQAQAAAAERNKAAANAQTRINNARLKTNAARIQAQANAAKANANASNAARIQAVAQELNMQLRMAQAAQPPAEQPPAEQRHWFDPLLTAGKAAGKAAEKAVSLVRGNGASTPASTSEVVQQNGLAGIEENSEEESEPIQYNYNEIYNTLEPKTYNPRDFIKVFNKTGQLGQIKAGSWEAMIAVLNKNKTKQNNNSKKIFKNSSREPGAAYDKRYINAWKEVKMKKKEVMTRSQRTE